MDTRIEYLFEKFKEKQCTNEELKEFYDLLDDGLHEDVIKQLLDNSFDEGDLVKFPIDRKEVVYRLITQHNTMKRPKISHKWIKYGAAACILFALGVFLNSERKARTALPVFTQENTVKQKEKYILLPDSSIVILNEGSKLTYNESYGVGDRSVKLEGEAYFHIKKNNKLPFLVNTTAGITTRVLGTKFNVLSIDGQKVVITVAEGRVQVENDSEVISFLSADQQLTYKIPYNQYIEEKVNASEVVSWQSKDFYFDDLTLGEIAKRLEKKYNVSILISDMHLRQQRTSATFLSDESITEILDVICSFHGIRYKKDSAGDIVIYKLTK